MRGLLVGLAALACAATAAASTTVATNAQRPSLRVDARGNAEVSWTAGGRRHTLLVPARGRLLPGGRLSAPDVSKPASAPIPFRRVVRRTPDGRWWALQAWRVRPSGPVELRFSRWSGAPTLVTLEATASSDSERLSGRALFGGVPVTGVSPTPEGKLLRHYAFLECFACGGAGWRRMSAVATRSDGSFELLVRPTFRGTQYRAIVAGPNRGSTYAPDAVATVATSS